MKKSNTSLIVMLIAITLVFVVSMAMSQTVTLRGKQFIVEGNSKRAEAFDSITNYTYRDTDDSVRVVHLSKNLKAFVIRYSKRTGKAYRKYLPQVTEQLEQMR